MQEAACGSTTPTVFTLRAQSPRPNTTAPQVIDYARDIKPIFEKNCYECHGPTKARGRLRLHAGEFILKGGASGAVVEAGHSDRSLLIHRVLGLDGDDQMPLDKDPLTEKQIDTLRRWIAAGATYPAAGSQ